MRPIVDVAVHLHDGDDIVACDIIANTDPDHWFVTVCLADRCTIYSRSPDALRRMAEAAIEAARNLEAAMKRKPEGSTP